MKAEAYRDYLLEKYKKMSPFETSITRKELKNLVYRFLCERGLWHAMVVEVRHFCKKPLTAREVLVRMTANSVRPSDSLINLNCVFDWDAAIYGKGMFNDFPYSLLWCGIYKKWASFLGNLSNLCVNHLEI
jgi:hypothetical protein